MTSRLDAASTSGVLRAQFRLAHGPPGASLDGLTSEAAARCARLVLSEDLAVNGFLAARTPLALSTWRGRTGLSELPRLAAPIDWRRWAKRVHFEAAHFRSYAQAVYAATDAFLAVEHPQSTTCLLGALLVTILLRVPTDSGSPHRADPAALLHSATHLSALRTARTRRSDMPANTLVQRSTLRSVGQLRRRERRPQEHSDDGDREPPE